MSEKDQSEREDEQRSTKDRKSSETTQEGDTSFVSPVPHNDFSDPSPEFPTASPQVGRRGDTMRTNKSRTGSVRTGGGGGRKVGRVRSMRKSAANAMLIDAADSDEELPLKFQLNKSGGGGGGADKVTDNLRQVEFLSGFCKQCKKKKTMYQSLGRLLRRLDIVLFLAPLLVFAILLTVLPLVIALNQGGGTKITLVTTIFGSLSIAWLAAREGFGLIGRAAEYRKLADKYAELANQTRSVMVHLQSELDKGTMDLLIHHLDKFHQQVRSERDNMPKPPNWVHKRFTNTAAAAEDERRLELDSFTPDNVSV